MGLRSLAALCPRVVGLRLWIKDHRLGATDEPKTIQTTKLLSQGIPRSDLND